MANNDPVYLVLRKKDGRFVGHAVAIERPTKQIIADLICEKTLGETEVKKPHLRPDEASFSGVIDSFISIMSTYRNMIPFTIELSPMVSGVIASSEIGLFVQDRGVESPTQKELSSFSRL